MDETRYVGFADARCQDCRFSVIRRLANPRPGRLGYVRECRRYAPAVDAGTWGGVSGAKWPVVQDDDWCGVFESRDEVETTTVQFNDEGMRS